MAINIQQSIFSELAEFITSQPSLEAIVNYRVSPAIDQRLHELLEKNREDALNLDEMEEMNNMLAISHLMTLAKAKARLKLAEEE